MYGRYRLPRISNLFDARRAAADTERRIAAECVREQVGDSPSEKAAARFTVCGCVNGNVAIVLKPTSNAPMCSIPGRTSILSHVGCSLVSDYGSSDYETTDGSRWPGPFAPPLRYALPTCSPSFSLVCPSPSLLGLSCGAELNLLTHMALLALL